MEILRHSASQRQPLRRTVQTMSAIGQLIGRVPGMFEHRSPPLRKRPAMDVTSTMAKATSVLPPFIPYVTVVEVVLDPGINIEQTPYCDNQYFQVWFV